MLCQQLPRLEAMGYSLILGGALGNVADRVLRGQVVDFLDSLATCALARLNLADVAITIGALCLFLTVVPESSKGNRGRGVRVKYTLTWRQIIR